MIRPVKRKAIQPATDSLLFGEELLLGSIQRYPRAPRPCGVGTFRKRVRRCLGYKRACRAPSPVVTSSNNATPNSRPRSRQNDSLARHAEASCGAQIFNRFGKTRCVWELIWAGCLDANDATTWVEQRSNECQDHHGQPQDPVSWGYKLASRRVDSVLLQLTIRFSSRTINTISLLSIKQCQIPTTAAVQSAQRVQKAPRTNQHH
ncbi:hypothetical protein IQ07DRAFT_22131 [Pyrenochaeta sp. DS3sAY3a]|nr:hypothetical protein IQ07DRAFT_22131 [Pyrenochaeta sp. DS3sAY3a]